MRDIVSAEDEFLCGWRKLEEVKDAARVDLCRGERRVERLDCKRKGERNLTEELISPLNGLAINSTTPGSDGLFDLIKTAMLVTMVSIAFRPVLHRFARFRFRSGSACVRA